MWPVCFQEASYEYIKNEAERTLLEAMDAMEIAFSHGMVGQDWLFNRLSVK